MSANSWNWQEIGKQVWDLPRSSVFRGTASNALYSLIEYSAQPALMVISAPYLVARLGLDQYGIWMLVSSFTGTIGIVQLGLGDATIKYISAYKARNDTLGVSRIISAILALSGLLAAFPALFLLAAAPLLVHHVFKIHPAHYVAAVRAIQIGGLILWVQCIYLVFANCLKACEKYGPPAKISVLVRSVTVVGAIYLVSLGYGVVYILLLSAAAALFGTGLLAFAVQRALDLPTLRPSFDRRTWKEIFGFGLYSWFQSGAGLAFSQADRFLIAITLGTTPLTYYTLCVQVAQQIHGLVGAAFSFLFPHISGKHEVANRNGVKNAFRLAVLVNLALSLLLTAPLVFWGRKLLTIWMGPTFAQNSYLVLIILALGFCLVSLNVVPHFTLLGLGKVRFLAITNVVGGVISLVSAALLIPPFGLIGAAAGRLFYGPIISLNYLKVSKAYKG
jgi:O-antigen/teichoic acid export membrane protein